MKFFKTYVVISKLVILNLLINNTGIAKPYLTETNAVHASSQYTTISQNEGVGIKPMTKGELKAIIKKRYKTARVKDVDIELYNGQKVYDVDFIFRGKPYEAFVTPSGRILKVQIDPNVDDGD